MFPLEPVPLAEALSGGLGGTSAPSVSHIHMLLLTLKAPGVIPGRLQDIFIHSSSQLIMISASL